MASVAEILVKYITDTSQLSSATGDVEKAGGKVSSTLGKVGKAVAAGFAVGAVVQFGKASTDAAEESEKATNRLENVFASMGDTTGRAAKHAEDYAGALQSQTAIEDETIMAAQAMLATFGKVSDATARQAGIFDRATAAAADLAAAGFGSMESNAVQLGKALQDPVKGITALARSGVTFTEAQKAQIKSLVESNHQLEAQRIVLGAIEQQVGGTAAATATDSEKMAIAYGEVQESVGKGLLPVLEQLTPVIVALSKFFAEHAKIIVPLVGILVGLAAVIKVVTIAQTAWNLAVSANPIGLIVIGIAALIVAIVLLVKHWDQVTAAMQRGWEAIKAAANAVFNWFKANWPLLLAVLAGPFGLAVGLIIKHWDAIKAAVQSAYSAIRGVLNQLSTFVGTVFGAIGNQLARLAELFGKPADAARQMLSTIRDAVGSIADMIAGQVGRISAAVSRVVDAIKRPINAVLSAWNAIRFTVPTIELPSVKIAGKTIGGGSFGGQSFGVPNIPLLAKGGVVSSPTLAMIGEGQGREIVTPENLLRSILAERMPNVRVFIGERELTDLVRVEVADANTGLARTLLAGAASV